MHKAIGFFAVAMAVGCGGGQATSGGGQTGGGSTSGGESSEYAGPIGSTDVATGEARYAARCGSCHSGGAPALENIGWTAARMRQQIREGSGNMPAIGPSRLSNEDMESVLAYMVTMGGVVAE
jgi:mono/diheme cytochrome c family protein